MSVSFKSFSQEDTKVILTETVARLVVKDLVMFDGLSSEHKLTKQRIIVLEDKILTLQDVINNIQQQLDNRNKIIAQKDQQIDVYSNMTKDLEKALIRERRTKRIYKIGSTIGLVLLGHQMLLK